MTAYIASSENIVYTQHQDSPRDFPLLSGIPCCKTKIDLLDACVIAVIEVPLNPLKTNRLLAKKFDSIWGKWISLQTAKKEQRGKWKIAGRDQEILKLVISEWTSIVC